MKPKAVVSDAPSEQDKALADAFPAVPSGHTPCGQYVIVQIKRAPRTSRGGIIFTESDKATELDNTQVAKVVAIGHGAFKRRDTGDDWPEGPWYRLGDYVRSPKYGGDRWNVPYEQTLPERRIGNLVIPQGKDNGVIEFAMFKELDIRGLVDDPLRVKAYF